ncbi:hypothetical protein PV646_26605 [Streptomyces sp. ID05-26A]|nr:hypothetical protein [Streptomyces sp. ID05-26A]
MFDGSLAHNRDARLVFVAHSMGGLLARWYVEHSGGAEITRKLITLGTPYRGAAKALLPLINGVRKDLGPLAVDLTAFARSMPSLHQLLPTYACIDQTQGLATLAEITLPELNSAMATDAFAFHHDLAHAEAARPASPPPAPSASSKVESKPWTPSAATTTTATAPSPSPERPDTASRWTPTPSAASSTTTAASKPAPTLSTKSKKS